ARVERRPRPQVMGGLHVRRLRVLGEQEHVEQEARRAVRRILAERADGPARREQQPRDQLEQRRFAGAVDPEQAVDVARREVEGELVEQRAAAVAEGEAFDVDHVFLLTSVLLTYDTMTERPA